MTKDFDNFRDPGFEDQYDQPGYRAQSVEHARREVGPGTTELLNLLKRLERDHSSAVS